MKKYERVAWEIFAVSMAFALGAISEGGGQSHVPIAAISLGFGFVSGVFAVLISLRMT